MRQYSWQRLARVQQHELPHFPAGAEGIPRGVRPKEVVQIAEGVQVQGRVPATEPFHFVFRVQADDVLQISPVCALVCRRIVPLAR